MKSYHIAEGVDLIPANVELAGMEVALVNTMSRENVLKIGLEPFKELYEYILIDCAPSLGMLTINALTAASSVIIPVQSQFLPARAMTELLQSINNVKRRLNPELKIEGILLTLFDGRTNLAKEIESTIRESYGSAIKVYDSIIPMAVSAAEASTAGKSLYEYDPKGNVTKAYEALTREVLKDGERKVKSESTIIR